MRITFAGKPVCTSAGTDSPEEFSCEGSRAEQASKFLRGFQQVARDRMNEATKVSFTLFRPQASIQAAEAYCLAFRDDKTLPKYGTLELTSDDGSGTSGTTRDLANALYVSGHARYKGVNVWVQYNFSGGALSSTKPTS